MNPFSLAPGTVFAGDYRIVRPLANGGMGAVYVAEQVSVARPRALKVMHRELSAAPDLRARFAAEARVGAQIESDHVVQVVGAGIDQETSMPWLAMELLEGTELRAHVAKKGPMPAPIARTLFKQLCHGLAAAHDKQIVHRDLKPENVFLAQSKSAEQGFVVKLLDFGIAKLVAAAATGAVTAAMGTPMWMAPEQTTQGSAISPATDVWAVGLIAFYVLTGKVFWKAADAAEPSTMQIFREMVVDPIPPASVRARELGAPPLPPAFDAWFARCVNRDVSTRFPNARVMGEALDVVLSQGPNPIAATMVTPGVSHTPSAAPHAVSQQPPQPYGAPSAYAPNPYAPNPYAQYPYPYPYPNPGARPPLPDNSVRNGLLIGGGLALLCIVAIPLLLAARRRDAPELPAYTPPPHVPVATVIADNGTYDASVRCRGSLCTSSPSIAAHDTSIDLLFRGEPGVKVVVEGQTAEISSAGTATITLDLGPQFRALGPDVLTSYESKGEIPIAVSLDGKALTGADAIVIEDLKDLVKKPFDNNPFTPFTFRGEGDAPKKARAVYFGGTLYGTASTLEQIDLVATATKGAYRDYGSCGPYGYDDKMASHQIYDEDLTVFDRRTGKQVAKQHFYAQVTMCPESIMTYDGVPEGVVDGPSDELEAGWLKSLVKP